jgi:hypothetical protein
MDGDYGSFEQGMESGSVSRRVMVSDERDLDHYSRGDIADEATRYLAAATQDDIHYARKVRSRIVSEPFRALAPVYGADVAVVARWALSSLRRRFWRDVALAALFAIGIVLLAVSWSSWLPTAVAMVVVAAGIVTCEKFLIRRTFIKYMRRGVFNPAKAPRPGDKMSRKLERAKQRSCGNLVVFRDDSPFVGSGVQMHQWHLTIDVSHGAASRDGAQLKPADFTSAELHEAIIEAMGKIGLPDVHAEERLFVNGRYLQDNPHLLPGWDPHDAAPPPESVDEGVLRRAVLYPTPDARVYVCADIPSWQGQLVTTLFARAVHAGGSVYIEWNFHVLPPLRGWFPHLDDLYDEPLAEQIPKALGLGLLYAVPAFLKSPFALAVHAWRKPMKKARRSMQAWKIRHDQVFDYGALPSIREDACGFSTKRYFLGSDEDMDILLLQEALIHAIEDFLARHNVDLTEFRDQAQVVMYSTQKRYNVGSFSGTGIIIGDRSSISGAGDQKPPPASVSGAKA